MAQNIARRMLDAFGNATEVLDQLNGSTGERSASLFSTSDRERWPQNSRYRWHHDRILQMLDERCGPLRLQDFIEAGVNIRVLREMVDSGSVRNPMLGIYVNNDQYDEFHLTLAGLAVHGSEYLLCLRSAAEYHGLVAPKGDELWVSVSNNRNVLKVAGDYRTVRITWQAIQVPDAPLDIPDSVLPQSAWNADEAPLERTERYLGIGREDIYGTEIKITSPARTVCDLLRHMNRPVGRGREVSPVIDRETAFEALRNFVAMDDIRMVREFAERLGYLDAIEQHIALAEQFSTSPKPR